MCEAEASVQQLRWTKVAHEGFESNVKVGGSEEVAEEELEGLRGSGGSLHVHVEKKRCRGGKGGITRERRLSKGIVSFRCLGRRTRDERAQRWTTWLPRRAFARGRWRGWQICCAPSQQRRLCHRPVALGNAGVLRIGSRGHKDDVDCDGGQRSFGRAKPVHT